MAELAHTLQTVFQMPHSPPPHPDPPPGMASQPTSTPYPQEIVSTLTGGSTKQGVGFVPTMRAPFLAHSAHSEEKPQQLRALTAPDPGPQWPTACNTPPLPTTGSKGVRYGLMSQVQCPGPRARPHVHRVFGLPVSRPHAAGSGAGSTVPGHYSGCSPRKAHPAGRSASRHPGGVLQVRRPRVVLCMPRT
jgi:hypothetical protein